MLGRDGDEDEVDRERSEAVDDEGALEIVRERAPVVVDKVALEHEAGAAVDDDVGDASFVCVSYVGSLCGYDDRDDD